MKKPPVHQKHYTRKMIHKLEESTEIAMLVSFLSCVFILGKIHSIANVKNKIPPWVQHGVQRISGGTNCCKGHTGPKWLVLTFAPMLWYIWQHNNFCCHSEAVISIGWSLPWQNLRCAGPQDCQGWLVWSPWPDRVHSEKMHEPCQGPWHPLTQQRPNSYKWIRDWNVYLCTCEVNPWKNNTQLSDLNYTRSIMNVQ